MEYNCSETQPLPWRRFPLPRVCTRAPATNCGGPHFSNVDLAISKNFPLFSEKYKLQFRAEAYNAFNHPNFALPSAININQSNFGQITSTASTSGDQSARVLQFALRFDF